MRPVTSEGHAETPLFTDAVIACEQHEPPRPNDGPDGALNDCEASRQCFQSPETAARLRQRIQMIPGDARVHHAVSCAMSSRRLT